MIAVLGLWATIAGCFLVLRLLDWPKAQPWQSEGPTVNEQRFIFSIFIGFTTFVILYTLIGVVVW